MNYKSVPDNFFESVVVLTIYEIKKYYLYRLALLGYYDRVVKVFLTEVTNKLEFLFHKQILDSST